MVGKGKHWHAEYLGTAPERCASEAEAQAVGQLCVRDSSGSPRPAAPCAGVQRGGTEARGDPAAPPARRGRTGLQRMARPRLRVRFGGLVCAWDCAGRAGARLDEEHVSLQPHPPHPQAIAHHAHAAQGHGSARDHGIEQETVEHQSSPGVRRSCSMPFMNSPAFGRSPQVG